MKIFLFIIRLIYYLIFFFNWCFFSFFFLKKTIENISSLSFQCNTIKKQLKWYLRSGTLINFNYKLEFFFLIFSSHLLPISKIIFQLWTILRTSWTVSPAGSTLIHPVGSARSTNPLQGPVIMKQNAKYLNCHNYNKEHIFLFR